jgi:hypothetical protein
VVGVLVPAGAGEGGDVGDAQEAEFLHECGQRVGVGGVLGGVATQV